MQLLKNFYVIDTETTGINNYDQIIELAIVSSYGLTIYHSLYKPDVKINPDAQKINKISETELVNAPRFIDEWPKIKIILQGSTVIGHNIKNFDIRLFKQTLESQGGDPSEIDTLFKNIYDTYLLTKNLNYKKNSQAYLADYYGLPAETHRAEDDALQLLTLLDYIEKDYIKQFFKFFSETKSEGNSLSCSKKLQSNKKKQSPKEKRLAKCLLLILAKKYTLYDLEKEMQLAKSTIANYLGILYKQSQLKWENCIECLAGFNSSSVTETEKQQMKNVIDDIKSLYADYKECSDTERYKSVSSRIPEDYRFTYNFIDVISK